MPAAERLPLLGDGEDAGDRARAAGRRTRGAERCLASSAEGSSQNAPTSRERAGSRLAEGARHAHEIVAAREGERLDEAVGELDLDCESVVAASCGRREQHRDGGETR